jgi:hypothetical protein
MDDRTLGLYLSRILSGFYIFIYQEKKYKLKYPDITIKYQADILAQEEYDNNKFSGWPTKDNILFNLIDLGIWTINGDNELTKLEKQIEDSKVNLYQSFLNPNKNKSVRRTLQSQKKQYNKLYNLRHSLDYATLEGYCDTLRHQYILLNSIVNEDDSKIENLDVNSVLFNKLVEIIGDNIIDVATFKKIARSDMWRNYWSANKDNLFNNATVNWTDEQKSLVILTKMYDNARESMECPPDVIFEDDDMFDGWMILQKRENEKIRNKNRTEKSLPGKLGKANEIFLMANSKEEVENIYQMNDIEGRNIIRERKRAISSNQKIKEEHLPDIQRDLTLKSNEQRKQMRKR